MNHSACAQRRQLAIDHVALFPNEFRPDFMAFLLDNWHVYAEFELRSLRVASRRKHYSARTIAETIRHDSAIGELHSGYKLNGNFVPDMERLFADLNPEHGALFSYRERTAAA